MCQDINLPKVELEKCETQMDQERDGLTKKDAFGYQMITMGHMLRIGMYKMKREVDTLLCTLQSQHQQQIQPLENYLLQLSDGSKPAQLL
jgi:hypothetical protein